MILVAACVLSLPCFGLAGYCLWTGPTVEQIRANRKGRASEVSE